MDADYLRDLADLVLRMLHVVAGIAWIGASFYFIRLDLGLRPPVDPEDGGAGVAGEYWGVHGGGFYHSQKYRVAPPTLPEHLHWFKWEAYTTWLSGFALLVLLYWLDAGDRLVDPAVADLSPIQAVGLSAAGLALAWLVYDGACRRSPDRPPRGDRGRRPRDAVGLRGGAALRRPGLIPSGWRDARHDHGRERLLRDHSRSLGAGSREAAGPRAGPCSRPRAKQRSVHNNYLTLPVVFTMLAGHSHSPSASSGPGSFCSRSSPRRRDPPLLQPLAHRSAPWWILGAAAAGAIASFIDTGALRHCRPHGLGRPEHRRRALPDLPLGCLGTARRSAREPGADAAACRPDRTTVSSRAMPPGNTTGLTDTERDQLVAWAAAHGVGPLCSRSPPPECASSRAGRTSWPRRPWPPSRRSCRSTTRSSTARRWSGESNWIPWGDRDLGIGPENATSYPHPGELALYPGGQSETELLFPYGYCSFASKAGISGRITSPPSSRARRSSGNSAG